MRVIAGGMDTGALVAGIEIELEKNWKTYWRNPGGSGIPPLLDFSSSENVKSVDIRWPTPKRFFDGYATSLVYQDHIVLPLRVTPEDPAKAIRLTLNMRYGVCSEICVPAEGDAAMLVHPLAADDARMAARIQSFDEKVPQSDHKALGIAGIDRKDGKLTIAVRVPDRALSSDLFSHSNEQIALPLTKPLDTSPDSDGLLHFEQTLPKDLPDTPVEMSFVLVNGSDAVEQTYVVSGDTIKAIE